MPSSKALTQSDLRAIEQEVEAEKARGEAVTPIPPPKGFLAGLKAAAQTKKEPGDAPFQGFSRALGNLDAALGIKTPEQARARAEWQGPLAGNLLGQAAMGNPISRAGRAASQGALFGGQRAMEPNASPLSVGLHALLGAGTGAIGLPASSATAFKRYASQQADKILSWLHTNVPSWGSITGPRALYQMARGIEGQEALSNMYEAALQATKNKIPKDQAVLLPIELATAAKKAVKQISLGPELQPGIVAVGAHDLIDALPSFGKGYRAEKKAAMDALAKATGGLKDLEAANREYTIGSGWMDIGKRLFAKGETFDPMAAQQALRTRGKETFGPRGMGEAFNLLRGPGEKEIEASVRPLWERALIGAKLGGLGGLGLGLPSAGAGAGLGAGAGVLMIPKTVYKNVPGAAGPLSPIEKTLQAGLQTGAQQAESLLGETLPHEP